MTDVLRETLEERGRATPWQDVEALVAAGDRRVRRRRVTGVVAAAAVVAVLAVVAPLALGGLGTDRAQVAANAYDPAAPSWAVDGVVHVGDLEVDLGEQPGAYVLTDAGIVWIDAAYDVLLTVPSGDTDVIGSSEEPAAVALVTDGRYVGWLDREAEEFVGYDTATGEVAGTMSDEDAPRARSTGVPQLIALEAGTLWTYDPSTRDNRSLDLADPGVVLPGTLRSGGEPLLDVDAEHVATSDRGRRVTISGIGSTAFTRTVPGQDGAILSPDATYVVTQPRRDFEVFDVRTGVTTLRLSREDALAPVRWLGPSTLEVLKSTSEEGEQVDLVTCDGYRGTCETVAKDVAPSYAEMTTADGVYSYDTATVQ